jgi:hypothetical protein
MPFCVDEIKLNYEKNFIDSLGLGGEIEIESVMIITNNTLACSGTSSQYWVGFE